jgi:hypothetical protein
MSRRKKKEIERQYLELARRKGRFIPEGNIGESEEPDFVIDTPHGALGIEITEVLRSGEGTFLPVEQERFHQEVVRIAEEKYGIIPGMSPADVLVYFWDDGVKRRDKAEMALSLVEFVRRHPVPTGDAETFSYRPSLPDGFGVIRIAGLNGPWKSGESGGSTVEEIYTQLSRRIEAKSKLVSRYRANLPGTPIWLFLYSGLQFLEEFQYRME